MSYVVQNLDELAELFESRADAAEKAAEKEPVRYVAENWRGEADGWRIAAYIARRTTIKEEA